jgi:PAS domain S-box-containing protein
VRENPTLGRIPPARDPARTSGETSDSAARREEQYRLLVTYVRDYAIFSTDAAGVIRSWNEGVRTVLGYGTDEFVGRTIHFLFTEEDVAAGVPERELTQAATAGAANDDRWMRRSDGNRFWASGITTAIHDEQSNLVGFTKVLRDQTDRKQADEALRASEERLQLAATAARLGTWDFDPPTGCFLLDPRCRELFGIAAAATVDLTHLLDRIGAPHRDHTRSAIGRAMQLGEGHCDLEVETLADNCWIRITGRGYFNDERAVRVIGTAQDVTERKRAELARDSLLELERSARAEAESANRLKDEFLSTLSHELRTPLNAILGYIRLLRLGDVDDERRDHALQVIERNAQAQARLIEDILDISRMTRGVLRFDAQPLDLRSVVDDAIDGLRPSVAAKRLQLVWVPPLEASIVLGDGGRLRQVVTNLVANAIKFTSAGGTIAVNLESGGLDVALVVRDSGIGIGAEFLASVFEQFRQADATRARAYGGLGLGLSIVRHIVELHGGTVEAASEGENRGATFTVRLPVVERAAASSPTVQAPPEQPSPASQEGSAQVRLDGLRILVVDDEPDAVELMRHVLERRGAQVTVTTSAERALADLVTIRPHLLISDVGMPEIDGFELIHRVRERQIAVPAMAATAYARPQDVGRALAAGYDAHVSKPIDWNLLLERIVALCPPGQPG